MTRPRATKVESEKTTRIQLIWAPIISRAKKRLARPRTMYFEERDRATPEGVAYWDHRRRHGCHPWICDERFLLFDGMRVVKGKRGEKR